MTLCLLVEGLIQLQDTGTGDYHVECVLIIILSFVELNEDGNVTSTQGEQSNGQSQA